MISYGQIWKTKRRQPDDTFECVRLGRDWFVKSVAFNEAPERPDNYSGEALLIAARPNEMMARACVPCLMKSKKCDSTPLALYKQALARMLHGPILADLSRHDVGDMNLFGLCRISYGKDS